MNESYCSVIQICVLITSRMVDSLETTSSLDRPWYLRDRLLNDRRVDGCAGVHLGYSLKSGWKLYNCNATMTVLLCSFRLRFLYLAFILGDPNTLSEVQQSHYTNASWTTEKDHLHWDKSLRARYNYKVGINRNCDHIFLSRIVTYIRPCFHLVLRCVLVDSITSRWR